MAWKPVAVPENVGAHTHQSPTGIAEKRLPVNNGTPVLDSVPFAVGRCTTTRKDGKACVNRLRTPGEQAAGLCLGHMKHREVDDAAE